MLAAYLAATSPSADDRLILVGLAVLGLFALVPFLNGIGNLFDRFRPNPHPTVYVQRPELDQRIADSEARTRRLISSEVDAIRKGQTALREDIQKSNDEVKEEIRDLNRSLNASVKDFTRGIAMLEGMQKRRRDSDS